MQSHSALEGIQEAERSLRGQFQRTQERGAVEAFTLKQFYQRLIMALVDHDPDWEGQPEFSGTAELVGAIERYIRQEAEAATDRMRSVRRPPKEERRPRRIRKPVLRSYSSYEDFIHAVTDAEAEINDVIGSQHAPGVLQSVAKFIGVFLSIEREDLVQLSTAGLSKESVLRAYDQWAQVVRDLEYGSEDDWLQFAEGVASRGRAFEKPYPRYERRRHGRRSR